MACNPLSLWMQLCPPAYMDNPNPRGGATLFRPMLPPQVIQVSGSLLMPPSVAIVAILQYFTFCTPPLAMVLLKALLFCNSVDNCSTSGHGPAHKQSSTWTTKSVEMHQPVQHAWMVPSTSASHSARPRAISAAHPPVLHMDMLPNGPMLSFFLILEHCPFNYVYPAADIPNPCMSALHIEGHLAHRIKVFGRPMIQ